MVGARPRSARRESGLRRGRPTRLRTGATASGSGSCWVTSLRLPPVGRTTSGVPCGSVMRWWFDPPASVDWRRTCPGRNRGTAAGTPIDAGVQHVQDPAQRLPVRQRPAAGVAEPALTLRQQRLQAVPQLTRHDPRQHPQLPSRTEQTGANHLIVLAVVSHPIRSAFNGVAGGEAEDVVALFGPLPVRMACAAGGW